MIDALANHPGIGFVMVRSEARGAVAVGAKGIRYLATDTVVGADPVAPYGGHSADGLRRVDGMEHCPDIVVISLLDPSTDEVAAFEELIGSHGGLGGPQTKPFILHPSEWQAGTPIVGAEAVYAQIRDWMAGIGLMKPRARPQPAAAAASGAGSAMPAAAAVGANVGAAIGAVVGAAVGAVIDRAAGPATVSSPAPAAGPATPDGDDPAPPEPAPGG
jgi:hypothetical protein